MSETQTGPNTIRTLRREVRMWRRRCEEAQGEARLLKSLLADAEREVRNLRKVLAALDERLRATPTRPSQADIVIYPRRT